MKAIPYLDQVICADALQSLRELPGESVDLVVTSPPYNIGKEYETRRTLADYLGEQAQVLKECKRLLTSAGSLVWQVGAYATDGIHIPLDVKIFSILEELELIPPTASKVGCRCKLLSPWLLGAVRS